MRKIIYILIFMVSLSFTGCISSNIPRNDEPMQINTPASTPSYPQLNPWWNEPGATTGINVLNF